MGELIEVMEVGEVMGWRMVMELGQVMEAEEVREVVEVGEAVSGSTEPPARTLPRKALSFSGKVYSFSLHLLGTQR